jgi:predicted TIM-barrel fold metal-dependent hydrolase
MSQEWNRRTALRLAGGTALVNALAGTSRLAVGATPAEREDVVPAIDTHIHTVLAGVPGFKDKPDWFTRLLNDPRAMGNRVNEEMAKAGVRITFGMGSLDHPGNDPLGVAGTLALSKFVPALRAVGVADPRRNDCNHLEAVEAQLRENRGKIVAFKAYLGYLHFGPEDPGYVPYYKLAAKYDIPVIVHTGDNWSTKAKVKYAHPLRMDEVAVDHPDVRFVLAHFGNPWFSDAAEVLFKNPNVWADLSGLVVATDEQIQAVLQAGKLPAAVPGLMVSQLRDAIDYVGDPKKFLYGSDWPLAPMGAYRQLIQLFFPKNHHADVFHANAERVFKITID